MSKYLELTPNKTYATAANAIKAVEKVFPPTGDNNLTYFLARTLDEKARFFPVFLGERAVQHGAHFHFNVAG